MKIQDIISKLTEIINTIENSKDDVRSLRDYRGNVLDPYREFIITVVDSYRKGDPEFTTAVESFNTGLDYRSQILTNGIESLTHSEFMDALVQDELFFLWTRLYAPFQEFCSLKKDIGKVENHCSLARRGCCAGITVFDIRDPDYKLLFFSLFPENKEREALPCHCDDWDKAGRIYGQFAPIHRYKNYCSTAGEAVSRMKQEGFARFTQRLRNSGYFRV